MDPMFLSYSQVNGVPQESKLATYMRQNKGPPVSTVGVSSLVKNVSGLSLDPLSSLAMKKEKVGGTTYYYPSAGPVDRVSSVGVVGGVAGDDSTAAVLPPSPLTAYPSTQNPHHALDTSYYLPDEIRLELQMKNALTLAQPDPTLYPNTPTEVENYHELCPLEQLPSLHKAQLIGFQTSTFKATNIKTGTRYCLRRIHGFRLPNQKCTMLIDMWKKLSHSNIVQLRDVFTTKAFGDQSLVFVYDYHPDSGTLLARHFSQSEPLNGYADPFSSNPNAPRPYSHQKNALLRQQHSNSMLSEGTMWSYVIQLTGALRVIHAAGLACRSLDPSKVLLTARSRIRISCCGISDVLTFDPNAANPLALMPHYQQEDLTALGKLILALSCRSLMAVQRENLQTSLDLMGRSYSNDLKHLIMYLLSQQRRSIVDLMPMIGARYYSQLDTIQMHNDQLENELAKEMENGRLMRLMVKLGIINERPELNLDPTWAETGDRYMVKLFRDYLFHQVTEDGRPWLDMSHIVHCLNKLDSGSQEKICLMSRDEQCILVVTYEELKHCLEQSFDEIVSVAGTSKPDPDQVNP
ncbi:PAN2-PAN3 deadenylation complex subunit PAN3 isoform X2 [Nilaparvata lugens]|uniref:PAN2-PAN3 deadenylation complex subunit PAN3 isoform X2 n=1 Tax=Nilaparvata lugens TaxID=108931 RepID=UPI00193D92D3|nr:PAN2-PAN3 deadenylation complex subunit PAN3 isoform X2 [Nilaparvata lugens]